jgi:enhancing lycopene biosynthesis protein 2
MPKIGVILSGCGVMDGSEIHEAVLTLLVLGKLNAEAVCMAPNIDQLHVVDHVSGEETKEKRNVLVESARIARGKILDIKDVKESDIDGLILPGGYGAVKNLSNFAAKGAGCDVHCDVANLLKAVHQAAKPIGAICISPTVLAKALQGNQVKMTIGTDEETAAAIEALGHKHVICGVKEMCIDDDKKILSTPAYMLAKNLAEAYVGIEKLVTEVVHLASQPKS